MQHLPSLMQAVQLESVLLAEDSSVGVQKDLVFHLLK